MLLTNDGNVVALVAEYNADLNLHISTDYANTWSGTFTSATTDSFIHGDFLQLQNGDILAFGATLLNTSDRMWRSTDNGVTWTLDFTFPVTNWAFKVHALQLSSGEILFSQANFIGDSRVWRSTDNGASWTEITTHTTANSVDMETTPCPTRTLC